LVYRKIARSEFNQNYHRLYGTIVSTYDNTKWSLKGYNPIKEPPNRIFRLPLSGQKRSLSNHFKLRPGNIHDSNRAMMSSQQSKDNFLAFACYFGLTVFFAPLK
jgi:hypothetical protein